MPEAPLVYFHRDTSGVAPIAVIRCEISRQHGTTPAAIQLNIAPTNLEDLSYGGRTGTLVVEYEGASLRLEGCIIDQSSVIATTENLVSQMTIFDGRWRWQYGAVSGRYNRKTLYGSLIADEGQLTEEEDTLNRSVGTRELARRLMVYMGIYLRRGAKELESLPEGENSWDGPEVDWWEDNPAAELETLCERFGCRVVVDWDGHLMIYKIGQSRYDEGGKRQWADKFERAAERRAQRLARLAGPGQPPLPVPMPIISLSESVDTDEKPDSLTVATGPIIYQWDFELEAVGEDTDGKVKRLKDLSFAPNKLRDDGGFVGPGGMFSAGTGPHPVVADEKLRKQIARTVMKWYRVKTPFRFLADDTVDDKGNRQWIDVSRLYLIKPIIDGLVTTTVEEGLIVNKDSIVYGKFLDDEGNNVTQVVPLPWDGKGRVSGIETEDMVIPGNVGVYHVDTRKAIVKFQKAIFAVGSDDFYALPELRLRASFQLRDWSTGQWKNDHISRQLPPPNLGTDTLTIKRPDITPVREARFGRSFTEVAVANNNPVVSRLANEHIDAVAEVFTGRRPTEVVFAGFYPQIELDGVIRSISFSIDTNNLRAPITTSVYLDQDTPGLGQLSYVETRQQSALVSMRDKAQVTTPSTQRKRQQAEDAN